MTDFGTWLIRGKGWDGNYNNHLVFTVWCTGQPEMRLNGRNQWLPQARDGRMGEWYTVTTWGECCLAWVTPLLGFRLFPGEAVQIDLSDSRVWIDLGRAQTWKML